MCKKRIEANTLKYSVNTIERDEVNVHLSCFKCSECDRLLSPGDHFVIRDDRFVCSSHFDSRQPDRCGKVASSKQQPNDFDKQPSPTESDRRSPTESTFRNSNDGVRLIAGQPASTRPDHSLDRLPPHSNHPLIIDSQLAIIHHHSGHQHPSSDDNYSCMPNSMNLTDYSNDFDNFESALQANEANDRLYSHEYNLSPNDSNLPASTLMIDSYWTQVNSPLNEYENLDAHLYVQRKARSKRRKQPSDSGRFFLSLFPD